MSTRLITITPQSSSTEVFRPGETANVKAILQKFPYAPELDSKQCFFQVDEKNPCALAYDRDRHLFVGFNVSPARIAKVSLKTLERVDSIILPAGRNETRVSALFAVRKDIIIHGSYTNPAIFTRIDGRTMKITGTLIGIEESVNDKYIRGFTFDGKYLYASCDCSPGKIVKFNPFTMERIAGHTLASGENTCYGIVWLKGLLYVTCETIPGKVVKVNPNGSMSSITTLTLSDENDNLHSITTDGRYLYVGCATNPTRVVKIDPVSMTEVATYIFETGENDNFSIAFDGDYIICPTWQDPAIVAMIKTSDMTLHKKWYVNTGFMGKLIYIEPYWYSPSDLPEGRLMQFLLPNF